jgi:membrane associated rhomboid family serine protease
MPSYSDAPPGLPRPGQVVTAVMCVVGGLWLAFAVGMHWAGVGPEVFALFCGNSLLILHGQVWRLFSAPLLQDPAGFWHIFSVLLTLYFFAVPLEKAWGPKRLLRFLLGLSIVPSLVQVLFDVALPPSVRGVLAGEYWFGGLAVASGLTVAWALNNGHAVVRLYGVLPVSSRTLIWMAVGAPVLYLIFRTAPAEGIPALFGGSFAGWLLGGGTPSPLRRYWLQFRIGRLDAEVLREAAQRKKRVERSRLKVIEGGRTGPDPSTGNEKGRGPDGRWLN